MQQWRVLAHGGCCQRHRVDGPSLSLCPPSLAPAPQSELRREAPGPARTPLPQPRPRDSARPCRGARAIPKRRQWAAVVPEQRCCAACWYRAHAAAVSRHASELHCRRCRCHCWRRGVSAWATEPAHGVALPHCCRCHCRPHCRYRFCCRHRDLCLDCATETEIESCGACARRGHHHQRHHHHGRLHRVSLRLGRLLLLARCPTQTDCAAPPRQRPSPAPPSLPQPLPWQRPPPQPRAAGTAAAATLRLRASSGRVQCASGSCRPPAAEKTRASGSSGLRASAARTAMAAYDRACRCCYPGQLRQLPLHLQAQKPATMMQCHQLRRILQQPPPPHCSHCSHRRWPPPRAALPAPSA